jgi:hypothetical protein
MSTRGMSETFTSIWSALMLLALSIGGTMIMRKFHNSMAVGFFMGGVVAMSQMFFFLTLLYVVRSFSNFWLSPVMQIHSHILIASPFPHTLCRYLGYRKDQKNAQLPVLTETISAFFCLLQCILLGTFAAILGAHRSEILEKQEENATRTAEDSFETPYVRS